MVYLIALQAQPEPAGEHQREIQSRKVSLDNPIDNRKDHHTRGQDEPENHTYYSQPIGPRDKPENILQHPGDQRDQHTYRPQRVFKRIHRTLNLRPHPNKVLMQACRAQRQRLFVQPKFFGELSIGRLGQMRVVIKHNHRNRFRSVVASQNF